MAESTETRKERRATARAERDRAAEAAQARRRQRLWMLGGAALLAVVVVAIVALSHGKDDNNTPVARKGEIIPGQVETNARFADIPQRGISVGNPRAPLTLVEFADLQCPFCRNYSTGVMPALVDKYVRTGKLRMEFRNVSFIGNDSLRAAQMAGAAALQNKLWQYVDLFYTNQGEENTGYVTDEFLARIGRAVRGLDVQRALADRDQAGIQRSLTEAQTQWQLAGFTGTPAFLLGPTGGRMSSVLAKQEAPTVPIMSQRIDDALAQVR